MGIIIYLIGAIIFFACTDKSNKKNISELSIWKKLLAIITLRVSDYYYKGTPTKLVMFALRGLCWIYGGSMFSLNISRLTLEIKKGGSISFSLAWGEIDTTLTIIFGALIVLLVSTYLFTYKKGDINDIQQIADETVSVINNGFSSQNQRMDEMEKRILDKIQGPKLTGIVSLTRECIHTLRVKTAYKYLNELDEMVSKNNTDAQLLYLIKYLKGNCSKYTNHNVAILEYKEAYNLMRQCGDVNIDILCGYVFALCAENKINDALNIALQIQNINSECPWAYIPSLLLEKDIVMGYNTKKYSQEVLAESILLLQILKRFIILSDCDIEVNKDLELTYETIPMWILQLSYALSNFLKSGTYAFFRKEIESQQSKLLYELSTTFLNHTKNSEIIDCTPDVPLYQAITGYMHDRNNKWISLLRECKYSSQSKDVAKLSLAFALFDSDKKDEAIDILYNYGDNRPIELSFNLIQMLLAVDYVDKIPAIIKNVIDKGEVVPQSCYYILLNTARRMSQPIHELLPKLSLETAEHTKLYQEFVRFFANEDYSSEYIIGNENSSPIQFAPFYPLVYEAIGNYSIAIDRIKKLLVTGVHDYSSVTYIRLLDKSNQRHILYSYLRELRENGVEDVSLLIKELQFAETIHDHATANTITSILLRIVPPSPGLIEHRLIGLSMVHADKSEFENLYPILAKTDFNVAQIKNVFNTYVKIGLTNMALEFLYNKTIALQNQELRDFFYTANLDSIISKVIDSQPEIVSIGDIIDISIEDKIISETAIAGSVYSDFIGKKIGDEVILPQGINKTTARLVAIHTKYYGLIIEIAKDIQSNKSKTIRSFSIEELGENIFEGLIKATESYEGVSRQEKQRKYDEMLKEYRAGDCSLYTFNKSRTLFGFYELIFGDFKIRQIPYQLLEAQYRLTTENVSSANIVIDITSTMLLFELSSRFALKYAKKFIMPKGIYDLYTQSIDIAKINTSATIMSSTTLLLTIADDSSNKIVGYLEQTKRWIDENCEIVLVQEKLNLMNTSDQDEILDAQIESLLLAYRGNHILLSEDMALVKALSNRAVVNVETFVKFSNSAYSDKVSDYLSELNYIGHNITAQYIYTEYMKYEAGQKNRHSYCLECVESNPYTIFEVVQACIKILSGIVTPNKRFAVTNLLVATFKLYGIQYSSEVYYTLITLPLSNDMRMCIQDAFQIANPLFRRYN
jgi:hypothetical protein